MTQRKECENGEKEHHMACTPPTPEPLSQSADPLYFHAGSNKLSLSKAAALALIKWRTTAWTGEACFSRGLKRAPASALFSRSPARHAAFAVT